MSSAYNGSATTKSPSRSSVSNQQSVVSEGDSNIKLSDLDPRKSPSNRSSLTQRKRLSIASHSTSTSASSKRSGPVEVIQPDSWLGDRARKRPETKPKAPCSEEEIDEVVTPKSNYFPPPLTTYYTPYPYSPRASRKKLPVELTKEEKYKIREDSLIRYFRMMQSTKLKDLSDNYYMFEDQYLRNYQGGFDGFAEDQSLDNTETYKSLCMTDDSTCQANDDLTGMQRSEEQRSPGSFASGDISQKNSSTQEMKESSATSGKRTAVERSVILPMDGCSKKLRSAADSCDYQECDYDLDYSEKTPGKMTCKAEEGIDGR